MASVSGNVKGTFAQSFCESLHVEIKFLIKEKGHLKILVLMVEKTYVI